MPSPTILSHESHSHSTHIYHPHFMPQEFARRLRDEQNEEYEAALTADRIHTYPHTTLFLQNRSLPAACVTSRMKSTKWRWLLTARGRS